MNRHVNNTAANIIANTIAVCFVLSAVFVLSCEMPTDGNFGGNIRGTSAADAALAAPKNVRAAEDGESGTITITWDEVPEADGYNVYRSKGASSQVSLRGGVSRTSYPDSGKSVAPDTPYYYFVSAYQGEAESAMTPSGAIELSGGASGILAAPDITGAGLSAGSDNSIRLAWTAVPDAAEYRIYRSSNYDDKQYIFKHKNTEANYLDTGLMPGEYTYQVSAVGADGQEGYLSRTSDWVEVEAGGDMPDVPPAPQNVSARLGESLSIILSWQAVTGATKYYVMRSEDGETYTEIGFAEGETGYTNGPKDASPVSRGGIYYYRVKPYNGNQEGYLSRACGPVVVVPAKPVVTGVSGAANNFTLSWTLEGSADGFRLYRSANNVQYELLKTAAGNERAYTDLTAGVGTYYYRITAYNSGGPGPESDVKKVDVTEFIPVSGISGVPGATQPGTPLELQGAVEPPGATYKDIVWTVKDAGGTGAVISGGALTAAAGTVTVTATIAGGLAPDSPYTKDFTITVSLAFIPVSGISGVPDTAQAGAPLELQGAVEPPGATNKGIAWTVKDAGGTGAVISGGALTATAAGTVTVTATIAGGLGPGSPYTRDFTITVSPVFVPVSGISGVPDTAQAGAPLELQGTVEPPGAINKGIVWTVKNAGGTGAVISGGALTATAGGTVTVTATIAGGLGPGSPYTRDFTITVSPPEIPTAFNVTDSATFAAALASIRSGNAGYFTITVRADINLGLQDLTLGGYKDKTIALKGDSPARAINLAGAGSLFTVGSGVTLELEGITLQGRSDNNTTLVWVDGGALVMNAGSKIAGNRAQQAQSGIAGGVTLKNNSHFTMNGGEISGNGFVSSAHDNSGSGGVYMDDSTFVMNSGKITGNTPTSAHSIGMAAGIFMNKNSSFTMYGGEISHNTVTYTWFNGFKVGGVIVGGGCEFTMYGGEITGNTETGSGSRGWGAGGVFIGNGTDEIAAGVFTMHGGVISANKSVKHTFSAGGVCLVRDPSYPGVFIKDGGVLYGSDADPGLANTTGRDNGAAVYSTTEPFGASPMSRNASLYENDKFDSRDNVWEGLPGNLSLNESLTWLDTNAEEGGAYTLTVNANETVAPKTLSYGGKKVKLTLKGDSPTRTYSLAGTGSLFTIGGGVTLELEDITLEGIGASAGWNNASLINVQAYGRLHINEGAKIINNGFRGTSSSGGGVYVGSNAALYMSGGEISGNVSVGSTSFTSYSYGGGVYVDSGGTFVMDGGKISDNYSGADRTISRGGGLYLAGGASFTMNSGEISANSLDHNPNFADPSSEGMGVYAAAGASFTMNGGEISGNVSSDRSGNGAGVWSAGTFTMIGGKIQGNHFGSDTNTSTGYGGGVYVDGGTFTKQPGGTIYGSNADSALKNTARNDSRGHAVYVNEGSKKCNSTAGAGVTLDSTKDGGWE